MSLLLVLICITIIIIKRIKKTKKIIERIKQHKQRYSLIFSIFLIIIIAIFAITQLNITGFAINNNLTKQILAKNNFWVFSLAGLICICLISLFGKYPKSLKKIKIRLLKLKLPKRKSKLKNSITHLKNKEVYTDEGNYIGEVHDIFLEGYKIHSLKIKLDKKRKLEFKKSGDSKKTRKLKGIVIKYKSIKNIGDIILIDKKVVDKLSEHLE